MRIHTRAKSLLDAASVTSKPVWVFLVVEAGAILGLVAVVVLVAAGIAQQVALDGLPPWRGLAVLPFASAAAELVRATHPFVAARRWHGVLVRRIDERWGDER
jgi:hypothetical protein